VLRGLFKERIEFYGNQYGIDANKVHRVSFEIKKNELFFKVEE